VFCVDALMSFYWKGDPGEDGSPGKPGTAVVRCQHIAEKCRILYGRYCSSLLMFVYFSDQDVQKALAIMGIQVCGQAHN